MKRVYKYLLRIDNVINISMPKGAQVLTVQTQRDEPYVWALADTDCHKHVGSFQMRGGMLLFHVFDLGEVE